MGKVQIFDPTLEAKQQTIAYKLRPKSLHNLQVGLVDNTKFNSDKLLLKIAGILEQEYGAEGHIIRRKEKATAPDMKVIEELTDSCDVAIAGIGD
jgi:hypothetical protein